MKEVKFKYIAVNQGCGVCVETFTLRDIERGYFVRWKKSNKIDSTCYIERFQFTGMQDVAGVDIYECDIVKSDYYSPTYDEVAAIKYMVVDNEAKFGFDSGEQDAFRYGSLTVIGNKFQNPELLESK